ncbi:MAG: hypothetical protein RL398_166 [Planctomycetota bacterium]
MNALGTALTLRRLDRRAIQPHLAALDAWLLPDSFYGVAQTWPQLYRSDGDGAFFGVFDGDTMVSHCATRIVQARTGGELVACGLLGSVATAPERRGQGFATAVLEAALAELDRHVDHVLLWAENPTLYERLGFAPSVEEAMLVLARRPHPDLQGCRRMRIEDHAAVAALHAQKPMRIERTPHEMSGLLTTPGMQSLVRERAGRIVAYACCGKGADLHGTWHEFGGEGPEVASLLQAGMHVLGQSEASVLLPPYRTALAGHLGRSVVGNYQVAGPMVRSLRLPVPQLFVDGLDSV